MTQQIYQHRALECEYDKICLLVYKSLHGAAPGYLREYCKETHSSASGLRLRSTDKCDLHVIVISKFLKRYSKAKRTRAPAYSRALGVRRMKTRFGDRAFSAAGPDAGTNFLLLCVQSIQSIHLKLDLRPTDGSATHIPVLVDCKAPL